MGSVRCSEQVTNGTQAIFSNGAAFAAIKTDGRVCTWGSIFSGGNKFCRRDSREQLGNVVYVCGNSSSFAALTVDGSVFTWGNLLRGNSGADSTAVSDQISCDVVDIACNNCSFVAIKRDGSIVTWGQANGGGDSSSVQKEFSRAAKLEQASKSAANAKQFRRFISYIRM